MFEIQIFQPFYLKLLCVHLVLLFGLFSLVSLSLKHLIFRAYTVSVAYSSITLKTKEPR